MTKATFDIWMINAPSTHRMYTQLWLGHTCSSFLLFQFRTVHQMHKTIKKKWERKAPGIFIRFLLRMCKVMSFTQV